MNSYINYDFGSGCMAQEGQASLGGGSHTIPTGSTQSQVTGGLEIQKLSCSPTWSLIVAIYPWPQLFVRTIIPVTCYLALRQSYKVSSFMSFSSQAGSFWSFGEYSALQDAYTSPKVDEAPVYTICSLLVSQSQTGWVYDQWHPRPLPDNFHPNCLGQPASQTHR